jgi:hypothetical protein
MAETKEQQAQIQASALIQEIRKVLSSDTDQEHRIDHNKDATLAPPEEFFIVKPGFWKEYFGCQR